MATPRFFVWLPGLLLLVATTASGFNAELHQKYTQRGIALYQHCAQLGAPFPAVSDDDLNALALGTEMEDTTELFSRATHWHYAQGQAAWRDLWLLIPVPLKFEIHLHGIFDRRNTDLHRLAAGSSATWRREHFERAGRVLHYIQDMRVPAHVIPIHHGGGGVKDGFDEFIFYYPEVLASFDQAQCQMIAAAVKLPCPECLQARLRTAMQATTAMLTAAPAAPDDVVAQCWREVFWCRPESGRECPGADYPGFGAYLSGNNSLRFGQIATAQCNGAKERFDEAAYHRFFASSYRAMMEDILFMLLYAVRLAE